MKRIEFVSKLKGLADTFPIIDSKGVKRKWTKKAREDYLKVKDRLKAFDHPYRCPGIFELMATGYILPAWIDFTISTKKGQPGFIQSHNFIDTHSNDIMELIPRSPNTLKNIVKIHTPWHVVAPLDTKFLFLPVPYPDSFEFTNVSGILDPTLSTEINIQLDWHILDGEYTVKKGTPLGQIIPLTDKKHYVFCRDEN